MNCSFNFPLCNCDKKYTSFNFLDHFIPPDLVCLALVPVGPISGLFRPLTWLYQLTLFHFNSETLRFSNFLCTWVVAWNERMNSNSLVWFVVLVCLPSFVTGLLLPLYLHLKGFSSKFRTIIMSGYKYLFYVSILRRFTWQSQISCWSIDVSCELRGLRVWKFSHQMASEIWSNSFMFSTFTTFTFINNTKIVDISISILNDSNQKEQFECSIIIFYYYFREIDNICVSIY